MKVILVYEIYEDRHYFGCIYKEDLIGVAKNYPTATAIIREYEETIKDRYHNDNFAGCSAYEYENEFGVKIRYSVVEHEVRDDLAFSLPTG